MGHLNTFEVIEKYEFCTNQERTPRLQNAKEQNRVKLKL